MVVLIRVFVVLLFFVFNSCVKDSFVELSPTPSVLGEWTGDTVYYYGIVGDSLFLKNFQTYSVFSPPDTFVFYQQGAYSRVFYSVGKMGGAFVKDSGDFVFTGDSLFLSSKTLQNGVFSVSYLGFERFSFSKKTISGDSLVRFVYKKKPSLVSYSAEIFPIWENMCSNCHYKNSKYVSLVPLLEGYQNLINGVSTNGDYADYPDYIDTINPLNSLLYLKIEGTAPGSIMPQPPYSPLPEYQRKIILKWIEQGALFN
tara:strand:+ start:1064 stop:1831 length:768 start_codon:yes stop_codon:yes gene_type:complete